MNKVYELSSAINKHLTELCLNEHDVPEEYAIEYSSLFSDLNEALSKIVGFQHLNELHDGIRVEHCHIEEAVKIICEVFVNFSVPPSFVAPTENGILIEYKRTELPIAVGGVNLKFEEKRIDIRIGEEEPLLNLFVGSLLTRKREKFSIDLLETIMWQPSW